MPVNTYLVIQRHPGGKRAIRQVVVAHSAASARAKADRPDAVLRVVKMHAGPPRKG